MVYDMKFSQMALDMLNEFKSSAQYGLGICVHMTKWRFT